MIEFAQKEFQRVDIHRVNIGSWGGLLMMMMFVYVGVDGFNVEEPMKESVGEVVD